MCESCTERLGVATATDARRNGRVLMFCAVCLSDALAVGWRVCHGGR